MTTRSNRDGRWRLVNGLSTLVLVGLLPLVSACGGAHASQVGQLGSTASSTAQRSPEPGASKFAASLAYSRCMRSHGVADFPDPTQVGGGIQISGSAPGIDPQSSLFVSAQRSCRHLLPGGGEPPTHAHQQQALARMLHVSRCMRAHGISRFPDPTLSPPSSRAGYSRISSNGVAWLAIPDTIDVRSSMFEQAAHACDF
jgi:hypothetical protein